MGYIKHSAAIITCWDEKRIADAHAKAKEIYSTYFPEAIASGSLISPIVSGIANGDQSFFIAPDGSKEGWEASHDSDKARTEFLDWLSENRTYCEYIEVRFGGDDDLESITRSKHLDDSIRDGNNSSDDLPI